MSRAITQCWSSLAIAQSQHNSMGACYTRELWFSLQCITHNSVLYMRFCDSSFTFCLPGRITIFTADNHSLLTKVLVAFKKIFTVRFLELSTEWRVKIRTQVKLWWKDRCGCICCQNLFSQPVVKLLWHRWWISKIQLNIMSIDPSFSLPFLLVIHFLVVF